MDIEKTTITSIDAETTGLDPVKDRIVSIGLFRRSSDGYIREDEWKLNPGIPIPPEASAIHGITDEMAKGRHRFSEVAKNLLAWLPGAGEVLVGFNPCQLDIPIIIEELHRAGFGGKWPPPGLIVVDASAIFRQKEPRDLSAAVAKFCGRVHDGAHGALADAQATYDVLKGQMDCYGDLAAMGAEELAQWTGAAKRVDWAGTMERRQDGEVIFTHKKVRGVRVKDDPGYAEWMLRNNFNTDTKLHLRAILNQNSCGQGKCEKPHSSMPL